MKGFVALLAFILLTMVCWGVYGPVMQQGAIGMSGSKLRPFICVGMAYFVIAVVAPSVLLQISKESGHWTTSGVVWSIIAGAVGALGALGVILAMAFRGSPLYVMPLVFGCAPVVNTFLTMWWAKSYKQVNPLFIAGLIVVVAGAVTVLLFKPHSHAAAAQIANENTKSGISFDIIRHDDPTPTHYAADSVADLQEKHPEAAKIYNQYRGITASEFMLVILFTAVTAISWGVYGPTLHRGQMAMAGSRLRPFICVGLAYFLMAVLAPSTLLAAWHEPGEFTFSGSMWSLAGGAAGALGALGIIMAFNFGGKPIFVMPIVFGGAPVVNTFVSLFLEAKDHPVDFNLHPMFYAGLILVAAGAVTVLIFAPKSPPHAPASHTPPAPSEQPATT